MKTKQEFFDKTILHLRAMPRQAERLGLCQYLTNDGLKCAVGAHLPDGPWQECGGSVDDLLAEFPETMKFLAISDVPDDEVEIFWSEIQALHDSLMFWDESGWNGHDEAAEFADNNKLDTNCLTVKLESDKVQV